MYVVRIRNQILIYKITFEWPHISWIKFAYALFINCLTVLNYYTYARIYVWHTQRKSLCIRSNTELHLNKYGPVYTVKQHLHCRRDLSTLYVTVPLRCTWVRLYIKTEYRRVCIAPYLYCDMDIIMYHILQHVHNN